MCEHLVGSLWDQCKNNAGNGLYMIIPGLPGPPLEQRQQATVVNGTAVTQRVFMRLLHDIWTAKGFLPSQTRIHLQFVHSEVRQVAFKNKLL